MLDLGWPELMVIVAVTVVVIGPRELPRVLRSVNGYVRKARSLASEFQSSIEDMARDADLDDLKKQMKDGSGEFSGDFESSIDPTGDVTKSMREFKDTMNARYDDDSNKAPGSSVTPPKDEKTTGEDSSSATSVDEDSGKKTSAKKTAAKKSGGKKSVAKKSGGKKAGAKKASGKTASKKTSAKKASAKKSSAKPAPAKPAAGNDGGAGA